MKKLLCGLLSIALLSTCMSKSSAPSVSSMKSGTYSVSAAGYHGDIKLDVTVDETSIVRIEVVDENETEGIGKDALPKLIEAAISQQVAPVDSISGATLTLQGFNDALVDALTQAGANLDNFKASQCEVAKEAVEESYDVVVVGAGLAGLSSALTALQNGKSVVLIEKMSVIGGASAMAGVGVVSSLSKTFADNGGVLYTSVKADELIVNEGKVVGVKASSTANDYTFNAPRVILATGGYGANNELVADLYKAFVYAGAECYWRCDCNGRTTKCGFN